MASISVCAFAKWIAVNNKHVIKLRFINDCIKLNNDNSKNLAAKATVELKVMRNVMQLKVRID